MFDFIAIVFSLGSVTILCHANIIEKLCNKFYFIKLGNPKFFQKNSLEFPTQWSEWSEDETKQALDKFIVCCPRSQAYVRFISILFSQ